MATDKQRTTLRELIEASELHRRMYETAHSNAAIEWLRQAHAFCDEHLVMMQPCRADGDLNFIYHMGYKQCAIAENGVNIGKLKKPNGLNLCETGPGARRLKEAYFSIGFDAWAVDSYTPEGYYKSFNFETRTADPRLPKRIADMWLRYST